jgi:hypothetical protein
LHAKKKCEQEQCKKHVQEKTETVIKTVAQTITPDIAKVLPKGIHLQKNLAHGSHSCDDTQVGTMLNQRVRITIIKP